MSSHKKNRNIGAAIFFIIFSLLFFALIVRFVTIQTTGKVDGKVLAAEAKELYLRESVLKAKRGSIFDHNGEIIAEDSESYTLVAVLDESLTTDKKKPRHVVDPAETAKQLAEHIDMKEADIYKALTKNAKQVEFGKAGKDLSLSVKNKIEDLKLPGIGFLKDTKRFYPNGVFASHLIGYAQKDQEKNGTSNIVGKMGLEQSFNDLLTGKNGSIQYEGDVWNYILPNAEKHIKEPENGQDIYLTLDKKIQTFLEDAISQVDEKYSPERIMAVVADPKTGKILAMGQTPTFHPDTREGIEQSWHNEVIETSFEPGSTMKIFSLATAIEEGVFNPNDSFPSGKYQVDRQTIIRDHNSGTGWGTISYLEGVQRSSNVAFAYLLEEMGTKAWREAMDEFKFGQRTNIGLPNEATGKILYRYPVEKVTSVYGQGTTVTAIQMVQAMTAIANEGVMMKPYVVDKIVNSTDGTEKVTKPEVAGKPISKETAKKVLDVLETVVTGENGTGKIYNIEGYQVAGKTGTAQIAGPTGKYLEGKNNFIYSFLGVAPVDNPQLVMYVMVDRPQLDDNENGSKPVSMIFNTVMKSSLQYLNIKPEEFVKAETIKLPDLSGKSLSEATKWLKDKGLEPIVIGEGKKIVQQSPVPEQTLIVGEKVYLKTNGSTTIPDMKGWSKREVINLSEMADITLKIEGEGYVSKQSSKAGTVVKPGETLEIQFQSPLERLNKNKTTE
ncbi:penicillin-binding protein [Lederbergia galactosidilytica]|uniref:serine-type D-Ala-D-Ala carboxypeptidase n=1 Tax=Lederbergia galactosidilytica TaxID=217031 RepID=A0A177ZHW7_9BACI|nr:penicillin-binding protein [Lederbergia galactosidilytica]OAK67069.1 penicillin-binding protein [Lederbergia galactosidilytica]